MICKKRLILKMTMIVIDKPSNSTNLRQNTPIGRMQIVSMDKLRISMIRAGKTFEDTITVVCEQISKQIDSDLMILSKKN